MTPDQIADTAAPNEGAEVNDELLKLSFVPAAIRDHYEGTEHEDRVNAMSDEELRAAGSECLSGDIVYNAFCAALDLALGIREYA